MSDEETFLAALRASPSDDTTRLVYADWLDERGEAAKAEYLRLVATIAGAGGDLTDRPEGAALAAFGTTLADDWRFATGARFVVTLFGYAHDRKINAIKHIREAIGCGLAEAKEMSEKLPYRLRDGLMFDRAREIALHIRQAPEAVVAVLPTELERLPFAVHYEVVAECSVWGEQPARDHALPAARAALADFLTRITGAPPADASTNSDMVVLASNLSAGEADDRARVLSQQLPAFNFRGGWSIRVFARHAAVATDSL